MHKRIKPMTHPFNGYVEMNEEPVRQERQPAKLFRVRPNPLNRHEVERLIERMDEVFTDVA